MVSSRVLRFLGGIGIAGALFLPTIVGPGTAAAQQVYRVDTVLSSNGYRFVPPAITVPVGATVTWTTSSTDRFSHTVTSDPGDRSLRRC